MSVCSSKLPTVSSCDSREFFGSHIKLPWPCTPGWSWQGINVAQEQPSSLGRRGLCVMARDSHPSGRTEAGVCSASFPRIPHKIMLWSATVVTAYYDTLVGCPCPVPAPLPRLRSVFPTLARWAPCPWILASGFASGGTQTGTLSSLFPPWGLRSLVSAKLLGTAFQAPHPQAIPPPQTWALPQCTRFLLPRPIPPSSAVCPALSHQRTGVDLDLGGQGLLLTMALT